MVVWTYTSISSDDVVTFTSPGSPPNSLSFPISNIAFILPPSDGDGYKLSTLVYFSIPPSSPLPLLHVISIDDSTSSHFSRHLLSPQSPSRALHLIINSTAGARKGGELFSSVLEPLFNLIELNYKVYETKGVDDAGVIAREIVAEVGEGESATIGIVGGDGTVHEVLNGLYGGENESTKVKVEIVLLPFGTANALYYHLFPPESPATPSDSALSSLYSLLSYLRSSSATSLSSLSLARNTTSHSSPSKSTITSVVASAALHAAILHDAETLRDQYPGVERFKVAAQKNASVWTEGTLTLFSPISSYNPKSKVLEESGEKTLVLEGPFVYLASSLISRFESNFIVAPLRSPSSPYPPSPDKPSIDLILIRLTRGFPDDTPSTHFEEKKVREEFAGKLWKVTGGMYSGGKHIDELYEGSDRAIVEYFRCSSFDWSPAKSENPNATLICLDGAVQRLGKGETLQSEAMGRDEADVRVWT